MSRVILLLALAQLVGTTIFAQTAAEIDSIKTEIIKHLKDLPRPSDSSKAYEPPAPVPDTVHYAHVHSYKPQVDPAIFETAFFLLSSYKQDTTTFYFVAIDMGNLNCETGRLIACDPIVMADALPFAQQFPVGRFPVQLSIAANKTHERVAFSRILFSDQPVARWEFALQKGQQQKSIFDSTFYSYGVDGGIGIFIDSSANKAFADARNKDEYFWEKAFNGELTKHDHLSWQYALFNFQDHNVATFTTGWGDGHYATYVGYDKEGKICRLLTDFGLFDWWLQKDVPASKK
jgi:Protein of unknown function (DUF4241)